MKVLVLGAGVVGTTSAWYLAQAGHDVLSDALMRELGIVDTPSVGDGTFRIFGQKIFITYGEHDMTDNIVHLVLART